jgi:sulfotransferase family protein
MQALRDRTLFFLHLPKTAGTSMRVLLSCRFAPADILAFEQSDSPELRRQKLANVGRYGLVHGHMPYALVDLFERRPFVLTVLRDPVDRAVSAFHYMQQMAASVAQGFKDGSTSATRARDYAAAARLPLGEFVRQAPLAAQRHLGNVQAWLLATPDVNGSGEYGDDHRVSVSPADLERAKEHLAACDAVGLTERMTESIELLAHSLQARPLGEISSANRTIRPALAALDAATTAALADITTADRELYAFACELFEERRRAMMRRLLVLGADQVRPVAERARFVPSPVFTFDSPVPGDGWYGPEHDGARWFSWTGPACASSIELASPPGAEFVLRLGVLHAMSAEFLSGLDVRLNGVRLHVRAEPAAAGHVLTAAVPRALMGAPGEGNWIVIRLPRVIRPCEQDPAAHDSRLLGIAVHRIELTAIEP